VLFFVAAKLGSAASIVKATNKNKLLKRFIVFPPLVLSTNLLTLFSIYLTAIYAALEAGGFLWVG
jgi:hypothetical protein